MGTDIHIFIEYREPSPILGIPSPWKPAHVAELSMRRWYKLFGALAGVRGGAAAIEPRGLPKDVSGHVARKMEGYHTLTHMTPDEFWTVAWDNACNDDVVPESVDVFRGFASGLRADGYEARLIIGFDS